MYPVSNPVYFLGKLLTVDLDGTSLIGAKDNLKRSVEERSYDARSFKKAFDTAKKEGFDDILINTGRNFSELCEIKDYLQSTDAPIDAISLEDGKRLLRKPANLTPEQWMAQLFGGKTNYTYFSDKNWGDINSAPIKQISHFLTTKLGYTHRKDKNENSIFTKEIKYSDAGVDKISGNPKWKVEIIPPGITVKVSAYNTEGSIINLQEYNKSIVSEIYGFLEKNGYPINALRSEKETCYINKFKRADINKKTVADYFKSTIDGDTTEVRAGNASNDFEMLNDDNVKSIIVGNDEHLIKSLSKKSNVIHVKERELHKGISLAAKG